MGPHRQLLLVHLVHLHAYLLPPLPAVLPLLQVLADPGSRVREMREARPDRRRFLFSCGLIAVAVGGAVNGVYKFSDSLVDGVCTMDNAYIRFDKFLDNVNQPLTKVETDFTTAVDKLDNATRFPPELTRNVETISDEFDELKNIATDARTAFTSTPGCEEVWQPVVNAADEAATSTRDSADSLSESLLDIQEQLNTSVVEAKQPALDALRDGRKALDDMRKQLTSNLDPRSYQGFDYAQRVSDNRDNAGYAQFFWVPLALFLSFVGLMGIVFCRHERFRDEPPLNNENMPADVHSLSCPGACSARVMACSWFIVISFGTLGALFALIFLPLTAVVSDACSVLPDLPLKLGEIAGNDQITNISKTCWDPSKNLFQGLGIDEQIQLDGIDFGNFTADFAAPKIDRSGIEEFDSRLREVPSACAVDSTGRNFTHESLVQNQAVNASITTAEDGFATSPVPAALKASGEEVIRTLKCAVQGFENATRCTFIKDIWLETVDVLCNGMNGSVAWIATAELVIAILAMPYMVTVLFLLKRYAGHGPTMKESNYAEAAAVDVSLEGIEAADASGFDKSTYA